MKKNALCLATKGPKQCIFVMHESKATLRIPYSMKFMTNIKEKEKIDLIERVRAQGHPVAILSVKWH